MDAVEIQNAGLLAPSTLAKHVTELWTQWITGRKVQMDRIAEVQQYIYATSTKETTNSQNGWSHTTHIPKLTQIYDNLGANYAQALFGNREFFTFDPASAKEAAVQQRRAITAYLKTKHKYNGYRAVMDKLLEDWTRTGNCFFRTEYCSYEKRNPLTGVKESDYRGPKLVRISPYDVAFDHTSNDFGTSPKIVKSLISRAELFATVDQAAKDEFDLAEVQKVKDLTTVCAHMQDAEILKHVQDTFDGFGSAAQYFRSGKVELLELYGTIYDPLTATLHLERLVTVADRRFVIRNVALDAMPHLGPVRHCGWRPRAENLWAQGPLDNLVGMQYRLDHLENAKADAFDQMLSPDRVHIGNVQIEQNGPVTNYYVDDTQGDVKNLAPDATALNADFQIERLEFQMEAYAGAPREAMGVRSPGEKTAFEVDKLTTAASRLFQHKIEKFEREIVEPSLNDEIGLAARNLDAQDMAAIFDEEEQLLLFINIAKADLAVKGKIKAVGASHYAKRSQLVQELQQFETVLATAPDLKVHFPAERRARLWNAVLNFEDTDVMVPFGQITETLTAQNRATAAQSVADEFSAAAAGEAGGVPVLPGAAPEAQ